MGEILPFPRRHRGDPPPRQFTLARLGFRWREGLWRRGTLTLSDEAVDSMQEQTWQHWLQRMRRQHAMR